MSRKYFKNYVPSLLHPTRRKSASMKAQVRSLRLPPVTLPSLDRKTTHLDGSDKELRSVLVASQGSVDRLTQNITELRADVDPPSSGAFWTIHG
jgi:hypothetical protein